MESGYVGCSYGICSTMTVRTKKPRFPAAYPQFWFSAFPFWLAALGFCSYISSPSEKVTIFSLELPFCFCSCSAFLSASRPFLLPGSETVLIGSIEIKGWCRFEDLLQKSVLRVPLWVCCQSCLCWQSPLGGLAQLSDWWWQRMLRPVPLTLWFCIKGNCVISPAMPPSSSRTFPHKAIPMESIPTGERSFFLFMNKRWSRLAVLLTTLMRSLSMIPAWRKATT